MPHSGSSRPRTHNEQVWGEEREGHRGRQTQQGREWLDGAEAGRGKKSVTRNTGFPSVYRDDGRDARFIPGGPRRAARWERGTDFTSRRRKL